MLKTITQQKQSTDTLSNNNVLALTSSQLNELCNDSLSEAVRNFQQSTNVDILELPLAAIEKQKWWSSKDTIKRLNNFETRLNSLDATLKTSYVSKDTFEQNKAEPIPNPTGASNTIRPNHFLIVSHLVNQLSRSNLVNFSQVRGFRTQRAIEAQLKRNPTFLSRIQHLFGR